MPRPKCAGVATTHSMCHPILPHFPANPATHLIEYPSSSQSPPGSISSVSTFPLLPPATATGQPPPKPHRPSSLTPEHAAAIFPCPWAEPHPTRPILHVACHPARSSPPNPAVREARPAGDHRQRQRGGRDRRGGVGGAPRVHSEAGWQRDREALPHTEGRQRAVRGVHYVGLVRQQPWCVRQPCISPCFILILGFEHVVSTVFGDGRGAVWERLLSCFPRICGSGGSGILYNPRCSFWAPVSPAICFFLRF